MAGKPALTPPLGLLPYFDNAPEATKPYDCQYCR